MSGFQAEKAVVLAHYEALSRATPESVSAILSERVAHDWTWLGVHPFNEQSGVKAVAEAFWTPYLSAFSRVQRRQDIFFAGLNEVDGFKGVWVVSMGHLMGLFDAPWLGIRPTRKIAMLRYAEFNRVESGRIVETAFFCDIPHLMTQAGQSPFPPATAQHLVQPGPISHNGLLLEDAPEDEGKATLAIINAMIGDLGTWNLGIPLEEELARTWHDDMIWWGPEGIGAAFTIERYAKQHSGPFRAAFKERSKTGHLARLAEGHFGGFFGWPNFQAVHEGGFLGMPSSQGQMTEFRVVDIYLRRDDKLAENWIFIDMLHWMKSQGADVLGRLATTDAGQMSGS
ncbi:MAG: ester cyclase [Boseongicola sp.]|nr:ester cyclase [Boseongicola sp.]